MRIGIDIDNCLANFDDVLLQTYLEHDKTLRNTGIINENAEYLRRGMFDWTADEEQSFYPTNQHSITVVNYLDVNKIYQDLFQKLGAC